MYVFRVDCLVPDNPLKCCSLGKALSPVLSIACSSLLRAETWCPPPLYFGTSVAGPVSSWKAVVLVRLYACSFSC